MNKTIGQVLAGLAIISAGIAMTIMKKDRKEIEMIEAEIIEEEE